MMLKDLIRCLDDLKENIQYYKPKDCFILGSYNLYTFRRIYLRDVFYIMDECECLRLIRTKNSTLLITDVSSKFIAELPIPEDKNEYFQLNIIHDYDGITYENIFEILDFIEYMEVQHGWKINGR